MISEAILLAGGLGTRLQKVVSDVPKPMAPVSGRPFITYVLDDLIQAGIQKFILSVGYKSDVFEHYFGNRYHDSEITYAVETTPLGTGGGILKAIGFASGKNVLAVNADTIFKVNVKELIDIHIKKNSDLTIALREVEDVARYGSVEMNNDGRVVSFAEKNKSTGKGFINGGVYIFKTDFFDSMNLPEVFSLEKDCLEKQFQIKKIYGVPSSAYFLDIGIPEDYEKAQQELS